MAQLKPRRFTKTGAAAVDHATNQPNMFVIRKAWNPFTPTFRAALPTPGSSAAMSEPPQWGRPAHNLANVTDDQLSAGETAQVIETVAGRWQIHQFGTAILISPGRWRLLCGQRGTQDAMGNPTAAGAWLIALMDDIAPVSIAKSAVGMPWNWRIGPARSPAANGLNVAVTSTPSARGAHRCSPTQFQRAAQGGSDQRLTWPRRICAATGDSGVLLKVPLG
ncbi:hypothetical protein [Cypionkella sp.]|uniref:GTA baseplate fiber-binding domain-containing protein n=1 Tax=Cypionkella sp. TaxID=2811411 RepID=UPI00351CBC72